MVVGKNVYSANQREWGLMVDDDNRFRFYLRCDGWQTLESRTEPTPGRWTHVAVTIDGGHGRLFVNGELEGEGELGATIADTDAPLTVGGINDGGRLRQMFYGAIDEVALFREALSAEEIRAMADRETTPHSVPPPPDLFRLCVEKTVPSTAQAEVLKGVKFRVVKPYDFAADGYRFLHGVALAWHNGVLYSSFGHNRGGENTDTEEARGRASHDGGKTWGDVFTIDAGEPGGGVSHGVFLTHRRTLWAFHGAYRGTMKDVHARAYTLDEETGRWIPKGTIIEGGFWPLQEPQKMEDGNWIIGGISVGDGNPAAVAISHGDNFMAWDLVVIPKAPGKMWGESSVLISGEHVVNIARYHGDSQTAALVAVSGDFGRTWTQSEPSNLPMVASKPYTGTLSTGQDYLICTTTADSGNRRSPLTIALTRPREQRFSKIFVIRHARFDDGPGESHPGAALSYPYAVEYDGKLYVGYSNSGGGVGRVGEGRELWNNNSAELAIIPISALAVD